MHKQGGKFCAAQGEKKRVHSDDLRLLCRAPPPPYN